MPKSLFDTVCAFLNTDGGTVYLGIDDQGNVTGVNPAVATRLKREIAGISNNPQKLDPPYLLFSESLHLQIYDGDVKDPKNGENHLTRVISSGKLPP